MIGKQVQSSATVTVAVARLHGWTAVVDVGVCGGGSDGRGFGVVDGVSGLTSRVSAARSRRIWFALSGISPLGEWWCSFQSEQPLTLFRLSIVV